MKALVLAAGRGTRMEELSETENKCMLSLHGKRLIEYSLESAARLAEIEEIVIVVGYRAESVMDAYGDQFSGKRISYVRQARQTGVVNAISCAEAHLRSGDFFLFLADEVALGGRHRAMLELFEKESLFCVCGVYLQENENMIRRTYSVQYGPDNRIHQLVEKPLRPFNRMMGTGNILFRGTIYDYIDQTPVNPNRGEKELPDLIQCAVDDGNTVKFFEICDHYININSPEEWQLVENHWPLG